MKRTLLAAAVLSTLSFGVLAETPSFNFVEIGYTQLDIDNTSAEPDGLELDFNFELSENYYLSADITDFDENGYDMSLTNLGFGFKSEVSDYSTVFAQVDWSQFDGGNRTEDGYKLGFGVRSSLTNNLEVTAAYEYLDIDGESSDFYLLGAAYKMTDKFSLYSDYKMESDANQLSIGVRMAF